MTESLDRLPQIEDRLSKAARGPWYVDYDICDCNDGMCSHGEFVYGMILGDPWGRFNPGQEPSDYNYRYTEFGDLTPDTAEFMAHSREDIEYLLAEVRRLRSLNYELDVLQYHPE